MTIYTRENHLLDEMYLLLQDLGVNAERAQVLLSDLLWRAREKMSSPQIEEVERSIQQCRACYGQDLLLEKNARPVPGFGMDTRVDLLFVGQMTGKTELAQGRPFRGPNSAVLREAFMAHGIGAEGGPTAYLTNLVKCVPAGDKPRAQVVHNCEGFLALEITALCPNIIVTLGVDAFRFFSGDSTPLKDVEGEPHPFGGKIIMPLKHPSAIHRIDDNKNRLKAMADFTEQIAGIVRMNAKYNELRVAGRVVSIDPEQLAIEE